MSLTFKSLKKLSQNLCVLFVEDDPVIHEPTAQMLKSLFKHVESAIDGIDAFKKYEEYFKLHQKYYDIIITDIQMPKLNGIELTKKIFAINKEQKVLIVSAHDDKKYLLELIHIGVEAFIEKPIELTKLMNTLHDVCNSFVEDDTINLEENCTYQTSTSSLFFNNAKIEISDNESKFLELLINNVNKNFTCIEIFNHLYYNEPTKEFSENSIKSLVKRLRKKVPTSLIKNTQQLGYSIKLEG